MRVCHDSVQKLVLSARVTQLAGQNSRTGNTGPQLLAPFIVHLGAPTEWKLAVREGLEV